MSLLRRHGLLGLPKPIVYFGSASTPADGGIQNISLATPFFITPPSNMLAGDLVYIHLYCAAAGPRTFLITSPAGQSFTLTGNQVGSNPESYTAWCTFNGSWGGFDPFFSISGAATVKSGVMHVIRPNRVGGVWAVDQAFTQSTGSVGSTNSTITGITNTHPNNVTIATWITQTSTPVLSSYSGGGWRQLGGSQYRNHGTNNKGSMYAFQAQGRGSNLGATGNVQITVDVITDFFQTIQSFYYT